MQATSLSHARTVEPEMLDALPEHHPEALGSRADLERMNGLMGNAGILARLFQQHGGLQLAKGRPLKVLDLGGGDGRLMLKLAGRWAAEGLQGEVTLIDRCSVLTDKTHREFRDLGWNVTLVTADVFVALQRCSGPVDVTVVNLFLHQFEDRSLRQMLQAVAERSRLLIACEPRRSWLSLAGARMLGLLGCNAVTRNDGVVSVRAGFLDGELSALWPATGGWRLREGQAGLFSHTFAARRTA